MSDPVKCPRCRKASVRVERVIKADRTERQYECGACGYKWKAAREQVAPRDDK